MNRSSRTWGELLRSLIFPFLVLGWLLPRFAIVFVPLAIGSLLLSLWPLPPMSERWSRPRRLPLKKSTTGA